MRSTSRVLARSHIPVLLDEVKAALLPALQQRQSNASPGRRPLMVDCTLGLGGHAKALLQASSCHLGAVDRDRQALSLASEHLKEFVADGRVSLACSRYSEVGGALHLE